MDPVREVAEAIVNLGIADELRLAPFMRAVREKPVSESTSADDSEANELLELLERARVIDAKQRETVEKILSGEITPSAQKKASSAQDPLLGKEFGAFRAIAKIGEGGMGSVYRAERHADRSQEFVVKVLSPLGADASTYVRFRREGEVMAALRHPNVVRVYASGVVDGLSYIIMEYVDGPTLQEILERKGRFDAINAAKAVRQVAGALEAAHAIGVIHRDVKPQNVILSRSQGLLKVVDFGLAKIHRAPSDPNVSRAGDILGSPAYIAPEQWGDHDVDRRVDLFALGIVLYQLVCGKLPFRGRTPSEFAQRIIRGSYEPPTDHAPETPEALSQIIARLLEKRREHRYATASQLVLDLERFLRGDLPDVPRLVRQQGETVERHALLGRDVFVLGRGAKAEIDVAHPSVLEKHAVLERTSSGMLLREIGGHGLLRVNGMRIREITVKDGDVIELADAPPLRYRAGMTPPAEPVPAAPMSPSATSGAPIGAKPGAHLTTIRVPAPLYEAFILAESPRAVLALVELLDETTWNRAVLAAKARLLAQGVLEETAVRVSDIALGAYRRAAETIPDALFRATRENLGADPVAWITWWLSSGREALPDQVRRPGPGARGVLALTSPTEQGQSLFPLQGIDRWEVGRANEVEVRLTDRSVSRKHAAIERLLTRFVIQDLGSRFGMLIRGERRSVALLRHDDTIDLGRAKAIFRQPDPGAPSPEELAAGIDPRVFDALVGIASPHVVGGLVALTALERMLAKLAEARSLLGGDEDPAAIARRHIDERRHFAVGALPLIANVDMGEDGAAWAAWWEREKVRFPVQVYPEGWGP
ncbi:protein kinase [bacterium]|nr:protein kinase [bacterium]